MTSLWDSDNSLKQKDTIPEITWGFSKPNYYMSYPRLTVVEGAEIQLPN